MDRVLSGAVFIYQVSEQKDMNWTIPDVIRSREPHGFRVDGKIGERHVRGAGDFCLHCGADLRVTRLRVASVSYEDVWRWHIAKVAERATLDSPADVDECEHLGITPDDRAKLAEFVGEALEPTSYLECGLDEVVPVGITSDGKFLYRKLGEYEITSVTREQHHHTN